MFAVTLLSYLGTAQCDVFVDATTRCTGSDVFGVFVTVFLSVFELQCNRGATVTPGNLTMLCDVFSGTLQVWLAYICGNSMQPSFAVTSCNYAV